MDKRLFVFYRCFFQSMKKHKVDTFLSLGNILVNQAVSILFLYVIFSSVPELGKWNHDQLLLIYGLFVWNKGLANFFTTSLYSIEKHITEGSFDGILVRPVLPIYQILGESLEIGELVNMVVGAALLAVSLVKLPEVNSIVVTVVLLLFSILSVALIFAIRLICMSVAFWTLTSFPVAIAVDNVSDFAKYPTGIYNKGLKFMLDYIVPFSIIAYFPACVILEESAKSVWISLVVTTVLFVLSPGIWNLGIKHYKSGGH